MPTSHKDRRGWWGSGDDGAAGIRRSDKTGSSGTVLRCDAAQQNSRTNLLAVAKAGYIPKVG
jgi:hypothetical protein